MLTPVDLHSDTASRVRTIIMRALVESWSKLVFVHDMGLRIVYVSFWHMPPKYTVYVLFTYLARNHLHVPS